MSSEIRNTPKAFVLRIAPSRRDRVKQALDANTLIIGWSKARGLLDPELSWHQFRKIVHDTCYATEESYRKSGAAAGNLRRFIRDMKVGDLVVVPHGSKFYVAKVDGEPTFSPELVSEDTAYRRPVRWLNDRHAIPRSQAKSPLVSRLKIRQTCADASDLLDEIRDALEIREAEQPPSFGSDLRRRLVESTLEEIRGGRLDERKFEFLIKQVLKALGGTDVRVIKDRTIDQGADVLARFAVADTIPFTLAVQAKYYAPEPPVTRKAVEQLVDGMNAEGADLGWVVTSGTFSSDAERKRDDVEEETAFRIELIDGEQFAGLIVDSGLKAVVGFEERIKDADNG